MHALAELIFFGLAPLIFGGLVMPQPVSAEEATISGEVNYRERVALPRRAILTVQLTDLSAAGAAAPVVAKETIRAINQVPISFTMSFDESVLQPGKLYGIQAQISVDGKVWFENAASSPVEPGNRKSCFWINQRPDGLPGCGMNEKAGTEPGFFNAINVLPQFPESPAQPTISVSENQYLISSAAVSGASEP